MKRVKIGVVGCGAIAQVHHMPNLLELQDEFEVTAVCDISAGAAAYVANRFHVPHHHTDYRDLLAADLEAVLLCHGDPKTEIALASFAAGKHALVEKPVCFSLQEIDAMVAAKNRAGTVGQAAYMKVFDPAFEVARREVETMENIQFVQINHLHPSNSLHLLQFHLERFDDLPEEPIAAARAAREKAVRDAIGDVPPIVVRGFNLLSGSMIHDLYGLRTMMGMPTHVVSTEIWRRGRGITLTLAYEDGARCVATWVDLPNLWDFRETLEIYGDDKRVLVSYPTGFSRGILSTVTIQGVDDDGRACRKEPAIDWESAFKRELRHFHDCVTNGTPCLTPIEDARLDISLIIDIAKAYSGPS